MIALGISRSSTRPPLLMVRSTWQVLGAGRFLREGIYASCNRRIWQTSEDHTTSRYMGCIEPVEACLACAGWLGGHRLCIGPHGTRKACLYGDFFAINLHGIAIITR